MREKTIQGVCAAVAAPRDTRGAPDETAFRRSLEYLMGMGIRAFAINGATGEYCLTSREDLRRIATLAVDVTRGQAEVICGIGSAGIHGCLENAETALRAGVRSLLLPMPHFFPYAETDLEAFCREVSVNVAAPILLYNLPFSSPLNLRTVETLLRECPQIVGIKDSSGSLDILRALARSCPDACRIVGSDRVLSPALREGCCDGVISGVAGVFPELILTLYSAAPDSAAFAECAGALEEYIEAIAPFPVPWGLKITGEFLGIGPATFSQPLSAERRAQADRLREWLRRRDFVGAMI
jgi:4-hydroxy-tetrahydrodipicolinate synthase